MMKYIYKLIILVYGYIFHTFSSYKSKQVVNNLPAQVEKYRLIKDLQSEKNYPFKVGLYQNQNKHKVVIKIWQGIYKDIPYYDLLHQIQSLKILESVHNRNTSHFPSGIKDIRLPKVEFFIKEKHRLLLGYEYISGNPLSSIHDQDKQIKIYHQVVNYLQILGSYCQTSEKHQLRHKSVIDYLFLSPFLLIAALINNPKDIYLLIKLYVIYLVSSVGFIRSSSKTLVHGDLNFKNIYIKDSELFVLDTEQLSFTYPEYELVTSVSTVSTPDFYKKYITKLIKEYAKQNISSRLKIVFLILNNELHNLSWHASPMINRQWYKKVINLALNIFWHHE